MMSMIFRFLICLSDRLHHLVNTSFSLNLSRSQFLERKKERSVDVDINADNGEHLNMCNIHGEC